MSEKYEFSGITKEDAIRNAEEELKIDKEALDVVVKDQECILHQLQKEDFIT